MLYGRPPFTAQSESALLSNILHQGLQIPSNPPVSEQSKDLIRKCLQVDENKRLRIKDVNSHYLFAQDKTPKLPAPQERIPLGMINNISNPNIAKDKRSHSQGVRDYNSRPIKTDNIITKKSEHTKPTNQNIFQEQLQRANKRTITNTDLSTLQLDKDLVGRSKSQKHMILDAKAFKDVSPTAYTQNVVKRQQSYEPAIISADECLSRRDGKSTPSQPKFKGNNDLLFSQINFCRFIYKFSQQLQAGGKTHPRLLMGLRDKLLFVLGKNTVMKINRLQQLNEKENHKENTFQLDDFELYRRSESFSKFSQAIWEYNEKYKKHFEKMFLLIQKNGNQASIILGVGNDKKFEAILDRDFGEFDSFYLISQSYVKQAMNEILQDMPKGDGDAVLAQEVVDYIFFFCLKSQFPLWIVENLLEYMTLVQMILQAPGDYKYFLRNAKVEQLVDKKPRKYTHKDLQEIQQRFNQFK